MTPTNINEVIDVLEQIIQTSKKEESPLGYFAALYQKVTIIVKEKLNTNYFDDDERMEQLDVIFANRYLAAYADYRQGKAITKSWAFAFNESKNNGLIVLQHLLLGMNAHINLDLGIAAAEISNPANLKDLQNDFNKINDILASLVDEIQKDLTKIWPTLYFILKALKKIDIFFINFSMTIARNGAWKFANELVIEEKANQQNLIHQRDAKIADFACFITNRGILDGIFFKIIKFWEKGNPSDKIELLEQQQYPLNP